jgi:elongation factor P hydroxylase
MKGMKEGNIYHLDEIKKRLKKTYDMFKLAFFNEYNIILISHHQFIDLTFDNMVKYVEYIFNKVNNIIIHNINHLILYNNYRIQLHNLLYSILNIDIDIMDVDSDIEYDDLPFIVSA